MSLVKLASTLQRARVGSLPAWVPPIVVGAVGLAACAVLAVVDPREPGNFPPCPFRTLTGLDCPGCGTLRAVNALTQGELVRAADHNLVTVVMLPVLVAAYLLWIVRAVRDGERALPPLPAGAGYSIAVTLVVFWVVRNLPWAPWSWLGSGAT